jgi:hypothetical protein
MYQLFIFFMITDPKTTVRSCRGQCAVAFLVAAVEAGLRLLEFVHAPYYALFVVGPAANLVEIAAGRRGRFAAALSAPAEAGHHGEASTAEAGRHVSTAEAGRHREVSAS